MGGSTSRSQGRRQRVGSSTGILVADEYAQSIRVYQEMTYQQIGMGYDFFVDRAANCMLTRSLTMATEWSCRPRPAGSPA